MTDQLIFASSLFLLCVQRQWHSGRKHRIKNSSFFSDTILNNRDALWMYLFRIQTTYSID